MQKMPDAVAEGLSVRAFEFRCRQLVDRLMGDDGISEFEKQRRASRAWKFTDPATGIIPIVLNGEGQALDVGRERRLATRAQRMALRAQYPTCGTDADCNGSSVPCRASR